MTTEEKAKAYDEALKKVRPLYEQAKKDGNPIWSTYEYIFPELRESEDERIRKWLIKTIHLIGIDKDICADQETMDKAIAWLEKQKEIPMPDSTTLLKMWDDEEKMLREKGIDDRWRLAYNAFLDGFAQGMMVKQKEQKPISQEDFDTAKHEALWEEQKPLETPSPSVIYTEQGDVLAEQKPNSTEDMPYIADEHFYERAPADSFKYKLAEYMTKGCTKKEGPYGYTYAISAETILKMAEEELLKRGVVQKPDIELIQRSWYMEGYHDREFGMEPRWIIKTGEGGPKHELNPKYGQPLVEDYHWVGLIQHLRDYQKTIDRSSNNLAYESVEEYIEWIKSHRYQPKQEWSEDDEDKMGVIIRLVEQNSGWPDRAIKEYVKWLKSIHPVKQEWSEEDEMYLSQAIETLEHENYLVLADKLKSLRPVKQEWSEEDEKQIRQIERIVKNAGCTSKLQEQIHNWLKSLRPSWKPSEEQMYALKVALETFRVRNSDNISAGNDKVFTQIESLYNELKKL